MTLSLLTRGYLCGMERVVKQVPLTPSSAQAILVKALEFPMPPLANEALGIFQADVILRSAIVAALADIRANPWLLEYIFASLPRDETTWKDYGEKSVQRAKDWFLKTEIPVSMVPRIDEGRWPRITISLSDSQETENTLGDIHYEPVEYMSTGDWPALTEKFNPAYDPQIGKITPPESIRTSLQVAPEMFVIDNVGREHVIQKVDTDSSFYIAAGTIVDLRNCVIKGVRPQTAVHLESAVFRETYHIGIHVGQEPVYLTWLHSIVSFALLRYREALLEARGLERTAIVSSDFSKNDTFEGELVFSRYITLTGFVRNYWPKAVVGTLNTVQGPLAVNPAHNLPNTKDDVKKEDALWVGELDLNSDGIG